MSHAVPGFESFLSPTAVLPAPMSAPLPWARAAAGSDSKTTVMTRSLKRRLLIIARRDISSWPRGISGRIDQARAYPAVGALPVVVRMGPVAVTMAGADLMVVRKEDRKVRTEAVAVIPMVRAARAEVVPAGRGLVPAGRGLVPAGRGLVLADRGRAAVRTGRRQKAG